jgi:hypothetical protein
MDCREVSGAPNGTEDEGKENGDMVRWCAMVVLLTIRSCWDISGLGGRAVVERNILERVGLISAGEMIKPGRCS